MTMCCTLLGPSAHFYLLLICMAAFSAESKETLTIDFPGPLCGSKPRQIDAAVLISTHDSADANSSCIMSFVAERTRSKTYRFMVNFNRVNITDCGVSLKVFMQPSTHIPPVLQLGCTSNMTNISLLHSSAGFTNSYLTFRLDKNTVTGYDFEIIVTAYRITVESLCDDFKCQNGLCIDKDFVCDGVNHCADRSDEEPCIDGVYHGSGLWKGPSIAVYIGASQVLVFMLCFGCFAYLYIRKRRRRLRRAAAAQSMLQPLNAPVQPVANVAMGPPSSSFNFDTQKQQQQQHPLPPPSSLPPPSYSELLASEVSDSKKSSAYAQ